VLMRSTTSNVFQNLMKHCFPNEMAAVDVDSFCSTILSQIQW
jgi:hypothetical protein